MSEWILGLHDTSRSIADPHLAEKTRSLTLDWSRFKYFGPVVEDAELDSLLARARGHGRRFCLVQPYGHVLDELWRPDGAEPADAFAILESWLAGRDVVFAGRAAGGGSVEASPLFVDLERWETLGRPRCRDALRDAVALPPALDRVTAPLRPEDPVAARELARHLDHGITDFDPSSSSLEPTARRFLDLLRRLTGNLRRGVFVWNVESYADVDEAPEGLAGPLRALYSVAAGFKPNRILETHGFDASTRVVYYDYSPPGLRFRRLLLEQWDGRDYPGFLRRLFALLPPGEAYYCLWDGATPENLDWDRVARRWQRELDAWGGEGILVRHWRHYKKLRHEFVECDLFGDRAGLLERLEDHPGSVIWWSNAFFSVVSNWFKTARERREVYRGWLDELAARAPGTWLYGSSSDNVSVNSVEAGQYRDWYREYGGDELEPGKLHRREIRF